MSDLIQTILDELDNKNIDYVHWKSNTNIEKALSGEDDLDILVDPCKKPEVYKLFKKYHIIRGYSEKDSWQNEIFHFFGMDIKKKELVHIHIHFLLEVGYDVDKSVNLPIVNKYIRGRKKYKYIYIPTVENEYVLLIIRLLLKNAFVPYFLMLPTAQLRLYKSQKSNGIVTGSSYAEFIDLNNRINREKLEETLTDVFPFIEKDFFYECEKVLERNHSLKEYFDYSKKLKNMLIPYRYHGDLKSFFISFYRVNKGRWNKFTKNKIKSKKIPENGGRVFAFVGGDGAGKTSNIEKLDKLLERHFYTRVIHIGRPQSNLISTLFLMMSKVFKLIGFNDMRQALIYLAVAYGRKRAFTKALKIKNDGGIAILDRIPLDGISSMDAPRIHTINKNKNYSILSKLEKNMYSTIRGVDELIVLKLDPKIALERRPEDDPDELLIRSGQIWEKDFSNVKNAHVLNTENTFEYIEEEILKIVWKSLNEI